MPEAEPAGRWIRLFINARICQEFPAYKLHDLRDMPAADYREVYQAAKLILRAREIQAAKQG